MRKEIDKAVETFHKIAFGTSKPATQVVTNKHLASFVTVLTELLMARYKNNWYPENPTRGSGYRCLRMNGQCMDPTIVESLIKSDIRLNRALRAMELTIWVDPGVVSVRIGEEGSIGTEDVEVDLIHRKDSTSEDEAYASRSPSPICRPTVNANVTPSKTSTAVQVTSPSAMIGNRSIIYHQNVSPPYISPPPMPSRSGLSTVRPVNHFVSNSHSQEVMPSGHIPASMQSSYSRPKSLFTPQDNNGNGSTYQGYYKDGMVASHFSHHAAMANRMPRNMMHQGNYYMDIPAQA